MGSEYRVYVGAYLKVDVPETEEVKNFQGCGKDNCVHKDKPQSGKFCNGCGSKLETLHDTVKYFPHLCDFIDEKFEDSLWCFSPSNLKDGIWIAMPTDLPKIGFELDDFDDHEVELPDRDIAETQCQLTFIDQIGDLLSKGASVELKYGIFHYYH